MRIENYFFQDNAILHQSLPDKIVRIDMEGNLTEEFKIERFVSKLITSYRDRLVMAHHFFPR